MQLGEYGPVTKYVMLGLGCIKNNWEISPNIQVSYDYSKVTQLPYIRTDNRVDIWDTQTRF